MKNIFIIYFIFSILLNIGAQNTSVQDYLKNIKWFGQGSLKIVSTEKKVIYIDPINIKEKDNADIILITHNHQDHYSPKDIEMILTPKTAVFSSFDIKNDKIKIFTKIAPNEEKKLGNISVKTVPAYNIVKNFHPKANNWVGYIVTVDGINIYYTGDTERIPEMKAVKCDIIFIPLGQKYTMNSVEEAAETVLDVGAKVAIPVHFGIYEGTQDDADRFKNMLSGKVNCIFLKLE